MLGRARGPARWSGCDAGPVTVIGTRVLLAGASLVAMFVVPACSGPVGDRQLLTESTMPRAEAVRWTGLEDTDGLTIDLVHQEGFQDTLVEVVLRGPSASVDRAMSSTQFDAELKPGLTVQEPPAGFDPSQLTGVRSAQQRWTNRLGQQVYRNAIRGRLGTGEEVIYFTAFST